MAYSWDASRFRSFMAENRILLMLLTKCFMPF